MLALTLTQTLIVAVTPAPSSNPGPYPTTHPTQHVNVYSGEADTCNAKVHEALKCYPRSCKMNDCDMETSCAAMYQGVNRMSRIRAYMQQPAIRSSGHKLISVPKS